MYPVLSTSWPLATQHLILEQYPIRLLLLDVFSFIAVPKQSILKWWHLKSVWNLGVVWLQALISPQTFSFFTCLLHKAHVEMITQEPSYGKEFCLLWKDLPEGYPWRAESSPSSFMSPPDPVNYLHSDKLLSCPPVVTETTLAMVPSAPGSTSQVCHLPACRTLDKSLTLLWDSAAPSLRGYSPLYRNDARITRNKRNKSI